MNLYQFKRLLELLEPKSILGEADIDVSEANYATGYIEILNIAPNDTFGCSRLTVELDLNKATTGWDAVSTGSDTLNIGVFKKTDGANYRHVLSSAQLTAVGNGTHATAGVRFDLGPVAKGDRISIRVKVSTERGDIEIPYRVTYSSHIAPVVTAVAAA